MGNLNEKRKLSLKLRFASTRIEFVRIIRIRNLEWNGKEEEFRE